MADAKAPRGGAAWEFVLLTFVGGLLVAVTLVTVGLSITASFLWLIWPFIVAFVVARRRGVSRSAWGLGVIDRRALYGAALAAVVIAVATVIKVILGEDISSTLFGDSALTIMSVLVGFPIFFLMGAAIEIPWRGFLLTEFARRGTASAIVWSSLAAVVWMIPSSLRSAGEGGWLYVILILVALAAFQVVAAVLRIRSGSPYAPAAFYGLWMSVAMRGQVEPSVASAAISAGLLVLAAAVLIRFWLPRSDRWPLLLQEPAETIVQ